MEVGYRVGEIRERCLCKGQVGFSTKISADDNATFPVEDKRYHLYVSGACPWAHRVMIVRSLLGLENFVSVSTVHPLMMDAGWVFEGPYRDDVFGAQRLHEVYLRADSAYTGRVTVPILFDRSTDTIVNNESSDIIRMFNDTAPRTRNLDLDLYPIALQADIDLWNDRIYAGLNNGVYRCGFATTQAAYGRAWASVQGVGEHRDSFRVPTLHGRQPANGGRHSPLPDLSSF